MSPYRMGQLGDYPQWGGRGLYIRIYQLLGLHLSPYFPVHCYWCIDWLVRNYWLLFYRRPLIIPALFFVRVLCLRLVVSSLPLLVRVHLKRILKWPPFYDVSLRYQCYHLLLSYLSSLPPSLCFSLFFPPSFSVSPSFSSSPSVCLFIPPIGDHCSCRVW